MTHAPKTIWDTPSEESVSPLTYETNHLEVSLPTELFAALVQYFI